MISFALFGWQTRKDSVPDASREGDVHLRYWLSSLAIWLFRYYVIPHYFWLSSSFNPPASIFIINLASGHFHHLSPASRGPGGVQHWLGVWMLVWLIDKIKTSRKCVHWPRLLVFLFLNGCTIWLVWVWELNKDVCNVLDTVCGAFCEGQPLVINFGSYLNPDDLSILYSNIFTV